MKWFTNRLTRCGQRVVAVMAVRCSQARLPRIAGRTLRSKQHSSDANPCTTASLA